MYIHKEGYSTIAVCFITSGILLAATLILLPKSNYSNLITCCFGLLFIVFNLFILHFFRIPYREFVHHEQQLICPADGKIVIVEEVYEPEYFQANRLQVSVFMSPMNVHVNRYPISGRVNYYKYHPGKYLVAWHPKSSTLNERTTVVVEHANGKEVLVRQIAGAVARRIVCYAKEQESVKQNQELGFIKFGSRVDLFLPLDTKILIKPEQIVRGGQTVIAEW